MSDKWAVSDFALALVLILLMLLFVFGGGCRRLPASPQQQLSAPTPVATAAPSVKVESAGPAVVEAPAESHAPASSAAPVVEPAPRAEAGRDVLQDILTKVDAFQATIQQQGVAMGRLADKIGSVENLQNIVTQFDLSDKQLELRKQELFSSDARDARTWRTMILLLIAVGGAGLIGAGMPCPEGTLFGVVPVRLILIAAGLVFLLMAGAAAVGIVP